jgi:hypothetical protein
MFANKRLNSKSFQNGKSIGHAGPTLPGVQNCESPWSGYDVASKQRDLATLSVPASGNWAAEQNLEEKAVRSILTLTLVVLSVIGCDPIRKSRLSIWAI